MGNSSSKKLNMNQRATTLLSISSADRKKKEKNNGAYVYSEVILSLFEPNGSIKTSKSSIHSLALISGSNSAMAKRSSTVLANSLSQKSRYLIQPKSATVFSSKFKVMIRGKPRKKNVRLKSCAKMKIYLFSFFLLKKFLILLYRVVELFF